MWILWVGFITLVVLLLAVDLGVFHRKSRAVSAKEALGWTLFWFCLSLSFTGVVYLLYQYNLLGVGMHAGGERLGGREASLTFLAGYLLEQSLSVDNIFVIALIITFFRVPAIYQHRLLFWGILGALIMRGAMIGLGTQLVQRFSWVTYVFGGLLIATAIKMLFSEEEDIDPGHNVLVRFARRLYPVTTGYDGPQFFSRLDGRRAVTPLFLAVLVIESTDLLFAVDSIPAVISLTRDPFLVFTSNVFAILGLRSLYFALAGMMQTFRYLKVSLVVLLVFIGAKMLMAHLVPIPIGIALGVIAGVLLIGVAASIISTKGEKLLHDAAGLIGSPRNLGLAAWRHIRRLVIFVVGATVVLVGIVMILTPGPAIAVIPLGLLILSTEFVWAKRLLDKVKQRIRAAIGKSAKCDKCSQPIDDPTKEVCPHCGECLTPLS